MKSCAYVFVILTYPADDDQQSRGKVDRDQEGADCPAEEDLHTIHAVVL